MTLLESAMHSLTFSLSLPEMRVSGSLSDEVRPCVLSAGVTSPV